MEVFACRDVSNRRKWSADCSRYDVTDVMATFSHNVVEWTSVSSTMNLLVSDVISVRYFQNTPQACLQKYALGRLILGPCSSNRK